MLLLMLLRPHVPLLAADGVPVPVVVAARGRGREDRTGHAPHQQANEVVATHVQRRYPPDQ